MRTMAGILTVALAVLAAAPAGCAQSETPVAAPDFTITDLEGVEHSLADYRGKVLFVNFWATWCPPCRAEIPDFVEVYGAKKAEGLEILGLSVDRMDAARLSEWVADVGITYPVALATRKIASDFDPGDYIPTTFVIDKEGRIRRKHVGGIGKEQMLAEFEELK